MLPLKLLAVVVSGLMLALCFPAWDIGVLVWFWMLPLLPVIWKAKKKRHAFLYSYLTGLVFWSLNLKWLDTVSGLGVLVMALFLSLYFGLWGVIASGIGNPWKVKKLVSEKAKGLSSLEKKIVKKQESEKSRGRQSKFLGAAVTDSFISLRFAFINAAAWVGCEWLRGWLFTGFSWNGLGTAFHDTTVIAQTADLVGLTGLSFMPVFMSAVIIQTGARLKAEVGQGRLKARLDFSVAALLLALQFFYGVWRIQDVKSWETQRVKVLLIQENIPQTLKWDPAEAANIMQGYAQSTELALAELEEQDAVTIQEAVENLGEESGKEVAIGEMEISYPDWVIWPESALPEPLYFAENYEGYAIGGGARHLLTERVQPLGKFSLITGMNQFESDYDGQSFKWKEGGRQYNSMAVISPEEPLEQNIQTYNKVHLVLFGEYIPLLDTVPLLKEIFKFSAGVDFGGNFSAGDSREPLTLKTQAGDMQVIPNICFEDTVGRLTRQFVRSEPQVIVNVTNDGWFKESEAAAQHMANAKFRAIELRRPMIRSANTGVSGIISTTGSYIDLKTDKRQAIEDEDGNNFIKSSLYGHAYAPKNGQLTLYAIAGDWFCYLMIACVLITMGKSLVTKS